MDKIFKTWKKATYLGGTFKVRNRVGNWAHPIEFPTVFTAYGAGIRSGNWQSCTSINTPKYVIDNFFDTVGHSKHDAMHKLWECCKELSHINWEDVDENPEAVNEKVRLANAELYKLETL